MTRSATCSRTRFFGAAADDVWRLAERGFRVVCPDTIGRGLSQWSGAPDDEYQLSFYARIATALFDRLELERVHWIGTSMGGAIGMVCASGLAEPRMKPRIARRRNGPNEPIRCSPAARRLCIGKKPLSRDRLATSMAKVRLETSARRAVP